MIDQEDLKNIRELDIKLYFILGGPGSDRKNHCLKLMGEFKYVFISVPDVIREEIQKKSKLGEHCATYPDKELLPTELTTAILIKAILSRKGESFLIDGFPRTLEQALYFDQNVREIKAILHLKANEEILFQRIRGNKLKIKTFMQQKEAVIEFYKKYGIIRDVDANSIDSNLVYSNLKQEFLPEIYLIIGKRFSGKSVISNLVASRIPMKCINFEDFLKRPGLSKHLNNSEFLINAFLKCARDSQAERLIIENFPPSKEMFNLFTKNGRNIRKIIYLNADDSVCTERMRALGKNDKHFIGCAQLNKEILAFEKKKDLIDYYKKKTEVVEIDACQELDLVIKSTMKNLSPHVLIFDSDQEADYLKNDIMNVFVKDYDYEILDISKIINEFVKRGNKIGLDLKMYTENLMPIPNTLIVNILKSIIFKENNNKYILVNYPRSASDIKEFEENVCEVKKMVFVSSSYPIQISNKTPSTESVEVYFKKNNRLFIYDKPDISDHNVKEILGVNRDFNIVYGLPCSGKKTITKYLETKFGYSVIDFELFIEEIKKIKAGAEGDPESITVDFNMFIAELQIKLDSMPADQKFLVSKFNKIVTKEEELIKLLEITGKPKKYFNICCDQLPLIDRYKLREGKDEMPQEEIDEYTKTNFELPNKYIEILKNSCVKQIDINNNNSESKTNLIMDELLGRKMIILTHDYNLEIENTLHHLATTHKTLVINVPDLIRKQYVLNNEWCLKLKNTYTEKRLLKDMSMCKGEEKIYYQYNPIHYQEQVVCDLIKDYSNSNSRENEDCRNIIIITGFLNYNLLGKSEQVYNLPLLEINKVLALGKVYSFIHMKRGQIDCEETEEAIKPVIEKEVKEEVADPLAGLDGQDEVEKEPEKAPENAEVDPDAKPTFKFEDYAWTSYNGNPRNYVQILSKYTRYPVKVCEESQDYLCTAISEIITTQEQQIVVIPLK